MERKIKIVVLGAGAAGIGFAKALQQYGEQDYLALNKPPLGVVLHPLYFAVIYK